MPVMIVESPNKIKKLQALLGSDWKIVATVGHFRDLPKKSLGVDVNNDFQLSYEYAPDQKSNGKTYPGGEKRIERIRNEIIEGEMVFIATDPDREGEAIAWHVQQVLELAEHEYRRITFTSIDKKTVDKALQNQRSIDEQLVLAQEARRALDRLVGYQVTPVLTNARGQVLSAGRVQSVALRLLVELEEKIKNFKPVDHFGVTVFFEDKKWSATWNTKPFLSEGNDYILDESLATRAANCRQFTVDSCETKNEEIAPPSCFSTSLLLQAAGNALKFSPDQTTKLAQRLFEQGLITYLRTDSVNITDEAIEEIRAYAQSEGMKLPAQGRKFKSKSGAQEAHEAIRPVDITQKTAGENENEQKLYELIWQRTVASQLANAVYKKRTVILSCMDNEEVFTFKASGKILLDAGWKKLTAKDSSFEDIEENEEDSGSIPELMEDQLITAESSQVDKKRTQAPGRLTEPGLVRRLENAGIGRPSTYSNILNNIKNRGYIGEIKGKVAPTELAYFIVDFLKENEFTFIDYAFTKTVEEQLDEIAEGKTSYENVVAHFYGSLVAELEKVRGTVTAKFPCPKCNSGLLRRAKDNLILWFCSNQDCKNMLIDASEKPVEIGTYTCEKCNTELKQYFPKNRATGKYFGHISWFCPNEDCKTQYENQNNKPVLPKKHQCPKCQSELFRFQKKNKAKEGTYLNEFAWGCSNEECNTFMNDQNGTPVPQAVFNCPKCKSRLVRYQKKNKEGKKLKSFAWFCSNEECKTFMDDKGGKPVKQQQRGA